jgi:hypothetical protein
MQRMPSRWSIRCHLTAVHLIEDGTLVARPFVEPQMHQRRLQVLSLEGRTLSPLARALVQQLVAAIACGSRRSLGRARKLDA